MKKRHFSTFSEVLYCEILDVNKCFESGKRVELLKTEKANGENAQVSYCYDLDAWVICSKNVSLVANCLEDL
jgi:hypothetical protein